MTKRSSRQNDGEETTARRLGNANTKKRPHNRARVMPRLTDTTTAPDSNATRATGDPPADTARRTTLDRGYNFHRLYTRDERAPVEWERAPSDDHEFRPHIDTGFNADGTIKTPDAPRVPGWNPHEQLFRWPDGTLRREYPPRNPYVVAARRRFSGVAHHCRLTGGDDECAKGQSHRFGVGVLWAAHARYLVDKLGIHPEWNDEGEYYGYDAEKTDPCLREDHVVNQMFRAAGTSYEEALEKERSEFEDMLRARFDDVQDGRGNASQCENLNPDGPGRVVDFRCEKVGEPDPLPPEAYAPTTGLDDIE